MKAKAWIENGVLRCSSQVCKENLCNKLNSCMDVNVYPIGTIETTGEFNNIMLQKFNDLEKRLNDLDEMIRYLYKATNTSDRMNNIW